MKHPHANPNCKACKGEGKIRILTKNAPPKEKLCDCTIASRLLKNADNGWYGVSSAPKVSESPLSEVLDSNVWMTAPIDWMKAHVRHIAIRKPLSWRYKVITDKELMASWLATAALAGVDILDKEAYEVTTAKLSIEDLVQPYDLVIFRLGVKAARNSAMPEVLLEALALRDHLELPTWVWDQPHRPLHEGHRCWSMQVQVELSAWARVKHNGVARVSSPLVEDLSDTLVPNRHRSSSSNRPKIRTLSSSTRKK